ncbi:MULTISPECIES: bifunctional 5,10-methylenetetrahydrofolate dehydrogenase/5,10-methenyltetrahydrofolate cyclohydrolase [Streptomyces]|uniref:bifunctional 5,10-methylenetetrahydrofolate dehydrogenase/5,10-methenyltetrahydrofolate cyclohydrolase n=1 Tax=Streptomyces TaxID=1883 RepID=UPI000BDD21EA|nr:MULTISPECIES: bifunctional 5,10-methylenetetrahydrofolate dehydrogenase/5,10-methenyltetrahydrofolate cyclohydrolase [unclassified Streptomyces]NMI55367.1 bifunctional 5,10-methylenetetrahydrofolate dehydrogenase/5,10-methenyltetrahydrofolate cyclohydrolase [Streptomyces sp. RLA2-12]QDN62176.1 bifunctional 5,10-methylenetetrahydrofolate dehydrogenase/5,10-methenyltetrahydrofolate cyclohydrolase [Streptomyces sp. S1D4-20]QDN72227.1 bifunctional 5,10-methylenetetrahydrofolate dehydrogenase/5,10
MSQAQLMDGAGLARRIVEETAKRAAALTGRTGTAPCLATVLVGEDPASVTYVRMKQNRSRKAGIESRHVALPADTTTAELVDTLKALSGDPTVHGILLQHPVGPHIDERAAFEAIAPEKDVDGVTLSSYSAMSFGLPGFVSCTPGGIMRLLDEYDVDPAGRRAVVVGRSAILGKPVGMLLLGRDATVTYCHSRTTDLPSVVREADIVVAAVGRPRLIRGEDIKPGAVVIDAGYNPGNVGDVDFDTARERARLITPVPGGVGPMTIAVLLEQTVTGAERQLGLR